MKSAILFLVFNRPENTKKVFEAIREAKPARLYVAADGPRLYHDDKHKCDQVRKIVTDVDWPCELSTNFREDNLGCKIAVSSAIDWFFSHEEEGIILEDDILPSSSFFVFCEMLLDIYRDEPSVAVISGCNPAPSAIDARNDYDFSSYALIWGWASWRRVWIDYDVDIKGWNGKSNDLKKWMSNSNILSVSMWSNIFDRIVKGEIDTWDYQLNYLLMNESKVSIIPKINLVDNIGFGSDATHTVNEKPAWLGGSDNMNIIDLDFRHPKINPLLDKRISEVVFNITKWNLVKYYMKCVLKIIFRFKV